MLALLADPGIVLSAATRFSARVVGAELNTAIGLARLGCRVAFHARVGADSPGAMVRRTVRGEGIDDTSIIVDGRGPTGLLLRDQHPYRAVEVSYHRRGSAATFLGPDDLPGASIADARLLLMTGITPLLSESARELTVAAMKRAKEQGTCVAFDPNIRHRLRGEIGPPDFAAWTAASDIVVAGLAEAEWITRCTGLTEAAQALLALGPRLVVLKCGADGAAATDGTTWWRSTPQSTPTTDPVGAGDAFNAGFIADLLAGHDVQTALDTGARCGRLVAQTVGDTDGFPTRAALAHDADQDVIR